MKIDINNIKRQDFWNLTDNIDEIIAYKNSGVDASPKCTIYESVYDKEGKAITPYELSLWISRGKYQNQIQQIREAESDDIRRKLKLNLPAVMFGGKAEDRKQIEKFSGLITID